MSQLNTLYVVTGRPAAGKTTFARQLADARHACLLDIDTATERIVQAAMAKLTGDADDRDSPLFKRTFREPIYTTLFALVGENLPCTNVVLTGPFTKELFNARWKEQIAQTVAVPCTVRCVFLYCDDAIRKRRLIERGNPRDKAKITNWEAHQAYYDTEALPAYPHTAVDTGQPDAFERALGEGLLD